MYKLNLDNGKYTVRLSDDCSVFEALRHGEIWQNLAGNNLALFLVWKVQELEEKLKVTAEVEGHNEKNKVVELLPELVEYITKHGYCSWWGSEWQEYEQDCEPDCFDRDTCERYQLLKKSRGKGK